MDRRTLVFLTRGDEGTLRLAGACALAAAAMGDRVDVFLLGDAIPAILAEADEPDGPTRALQEARKLGQCRIFACSQGLVAARLDPARAEGVLDAVVGWPTILEWSRGVPDRFFF